MNERLKTHRRESRVVSVSRSSTNSTATSLLVTVVTVCCFNNNSSPLCLWHQPVSATLH